MTPGLVLYGHESDTILVRKMIQIESAKAPFTSPSVVFQAVTALGRAEAMGLLPANGNILTLDLASFQGAVRHIQRAGIARNIQLDLSDASGSKLERALEHFESRPRRVASAGIRMGSPVGSPWAGTPRPALGNLGEQHPAISGECANDSGRCRGTFAFFEPGCRRSLRRL